MIYFLSTHANSSTFDPHYRGFYSIYDKGSFDIESWSCQLSNYQNDFPGKYCPIAKAGRIIEIVRCIIAIAAAVFGSWILNGQRDAIEQGRKQKVMMTGYWVDGGRADEMDVPPGVQLASI